MKPNLNPKASAHFRGPALSSGFEFMIGGRNQPDLSLILNPGVTFYTLQETEVKDISGPIAESPYSIGYGKTRGVASSLVASVHRMIGGEGFWMKRLGNRGTEPLSFRVSAPAEGDLIAIDLDELDGGLLCQRGSFFAAPLGVRPGWDVNWNIPSMIFGGLPFLFQKISAPSSAIKDLGLGPQNEQGNPVSRNWVFLHAPGDVTVTELKPDGAPVRVRKNSLLAMSTHTRKSADFATKGVVQNVLTAIGGGQFFMPKFSSESEEVCEIKGPCRIWTTNTLEA